MNSISGRRGRDNFCEGRYFNSQENSHFTAAARWHPFIMPGICTPQRGCCSR